MKVAIVHDDLVQWGGAERVLEGLCQLYPEAPIFTSVFDKDNIELRSRFGRRKVITSFLQKIPGWKNLYRGLLPFYSLAFEQFNFDNFDLVISHTTKFAGSIITKPKTLHVCYCHTPPRFLWNFSKETTPKLAAPFLTYQRIFDRIKAARVDAFIAGSKNCQNRIRKVYNRMSSVAFPFIDLNRFSTIQPFDGGYFVVIARLNRYKRIDLAVRACLDLGEKLKVIGNGPEMNRLQKLASGKPGLIEFLGNLDDNQVVMVLSGARALIIPGIEDFGITPLEAQILGKPVLALREGGVLETVIDNQTGFLFKKQDVESIKEAILKLKENKIDSNLCRGNAQGFSLEVFKKEFGEQISFLHLSFS